jgi:hypothetical protein
MRLKSAYRGKPAEAPNIPEEPIQPSETTTINFDTDKPEHPPVAVVAVDDFPEPDEATLALQKQLADLKKSEELQRQYAQHMAQQAQRPPSREEKLAAWRAMPGADEGDIAFLESNPEMIDRHDLTVVAAEAAAQQGFERGTDAHREATKEIFDRHLGHQQAQPAASARPAATDPAGLFEPPPAPSQEPPGPSSYVSAPVSRRDIGGPREISPRSVRLSPIEQEIARNLGLSDTAYAAGKLRLAREKATGERQQ